jgi:twitching motility two-component system response regulator PilH
MSTVLIVDDVQTDRELVGKVVQAAGHSPVYAADGDEAMAAAKQHSPSLVLMDVVMPKTNGFNACRNLKKDPGTAAIPVVLLTTKTTDSDRFWGKKQGADDHIAKPFAPDSLLAVIRRYCR